MVDVKFYTLYVREPSTRKFIALAGVSLEALLQADGEIRIRHVLGTDREGNDRVLRVERR